MPVNDLEKVVTQHKELQKKIHSDLESISLRNDLGNHEPEVFFNYFLNYLFQGYPLPPNHFKVIVITISKSVSNEEKKNIEDQIRHIFKTIWST